MESTKNHQKFCKLLLDNPPVSVLLQAKNDLEKVGGNDLVAGVVSRLSAYAKQFLCTVTCPHCGSPLYLSDLPQYEYVCYDCDENFFYMEVQHDNQRDRRSSGTV